MKQTEKGIEIVIIPVNNSHLEYANRLSILCNENKIKNKIDSRNIKLSLKIKESKMSKIQVIIGDEEVEQQMISYRDINSELTKTITIEEFLDNIKTKRLTQLTHQWNDLKNQENEIHNEVNKILGE